MAGRKNPLTCGFRCSEKEQRLVDAAARLEGASRAAFVKDVTLEAARRRIAQETEHQESGSRV